MTLSLTSDLQLKGIDLQRQPGNYSLVNLNAMPASALPKPTNPYHIAIPIVAGGRHCRYRFIVERLAEIPKNKYQCLAVSVDQTFKAKLPVVTRALSADRPKPINQAQIQPLQD